MTGCEVRLAATVTDLPKLKELRATVPLEVTAVDGRAVDEPARVTLDVPDEATAARVADPCRGLTEGSMVVIDGVRVRPLPDPPAEGFDYGRYLRRKGEHVLLSASLEDVGGRRKEGRARRSHRRSPAQGEEQPAPRGPVAGPRGAAGHGARRRRELRRRARRGLPPVRPHAHHGRVR